MSVETVGIIGVGLIGGSVALSAIRENYKVSLYDPQCALDERFRGATRRDDLAGLAAAAQLIIIATPISATVDVGRALGQLVCADHVVSDIASVKAPIVKWLAKTFHGRCEYVPAHPMAGSEKSGSEFARAELFEGAVNILCPEFALDAKTVERVANFWQRLGSRVVMLDAHTHDKAVGAISHLPHLLAAVLVNYAANLALSPFDLAGAGFKDMTRIAAGSPALWEEILWGNCVSIIEHLEAVRESLNDLLAMMKSDGSDKLRALLDEAKANRDKLTW
ncbi:MAG: prephenate dehydrogenase/arogenate dehydrogenase family protein [Verrucomicrobia bacterium]|nr:prephenate dehydrogenase/arogenate dehydrogenase family protein [Verrucomicrobiota bacterium]